MVLRVIILLLIIIWPNLPIHDVIGKEKNQSKDQCLLSRQRYKLADNQLAWTSGVFEQTNDRTRSAAHKIFVN